MPGFPVDSHKCVRCDRLIFHMVVGTSCIIVVAGIVVAGIVVAVVVVAVVVVAVVVVAVVVVILINYGHSHKLPYSCQNYNNRLIK